jgi:hypothetical protein
MRQGRTQSWRGGARRWPVGTGKLGGSFTSDLVIALIVRSGS